MLPYFLLGVSLLFGTVLIARWFVSAEPRAVASAARWTLAILGVIFVLFVIFMGRHALAAFALPALLPLLLRSRALWQRMKSAQGPSPGQASQVTSRFLRMTLDHDTGEMDGQILEGWHEGAWLSELGGQEVLELWRVYTREDAQSASLLEAFLDRRHGPDWREGMEEEPGGGERAKPSSSAMSKEEAYEILGVEPGASNEEISDAHRKLMQKLHPDHGGSNYLASKINQAKQVLLKK